jgi:hypothetical protein
VEIKNQSKTYFQKNDNSKTFEVEDSAGKNKTLGKFKLQTE